jgi:hypothetical protein
MCGAVAGGGEHARNLTDRKVPPALTFVRVVPGVLFDGPVEVLLFFFDEAFYGAPEGGVAELVRAAG